MESKKLSNSELDSLIQLIVSRLQLARKVAAAKWKMGKAIEDPEREQLILKTLKTKAQQIGIDLQWTERFFTDQFLASKMIQYALFKNWSTAEQNKEQLSIEDVDLAAEVRPAINKIDNQLFEWALRNLKNCQELTLIEQIREEVKKNFQLDSLHSQAFELAISHLIFVNSDSEQV